MDFNSYFINVLRFLFFTILDNALKIFIECFAKAGLVIRVWLQKLQAAGGGGGGGRGYATEFSVYSHPLKRTTQQRCEME